MINNIIYLVSLFSFKRKSFCREASTIRLSVLLKFDVAKLRGESKEHKKMASTNHLHKSLSTNKLQKIILYSELRKNKYEMTEYSGNLYKHKA